MNRRDRHPDEAALALLAGGDLPLLERWRVSRHVRGCEACRTVLEDYRKLRQDAAKWSGDLDPETWARLEAEMRANIRLGLAAGRVVDGEPAVARRAWPGWRVAAVTASIAFVFGAGVWLGRQTGTEPPRAMLASVAPVVEAGAGGLALRSTGAALELKSPEGSAAVRTVNWDGTARARYFDGETGQVTIHQVAWEDSDAR
ncbi:MAG: hypothetical protein HXY18_20005 [Bryobacteraceae bacterium]|nr:hypothetical protein [Bryobacteraceae bacterium]